MHAPGPLLDGQVAVVTGGAGGIGRAISETFATHGAHVLVVDLDAGALQETCAGIGAAGASGLELDVRNRDDVAELVQVADHHGGVGVLVNNVGHFVHRAAPFVDSTEDQWQAQYATNFEHVLRCTHGLLPAMIERSQGASIINLTSVEAHRGLPEHAVYSAFKAAVGQFTKSLALEVGRHDIRVNAIAPDVTQSEQLPYDRWLSPEDWALVPDWVPLGRLGRPTDPAGVALFLASDLAAFVTGTTIHVDGGTYAAGGWYRSRRGRPWTNRPVDP